MNTRIAWAFYRLAELLTYYVIQLNASARGELERALEEAREAIEAEERG